MKFGENTIKFEEIAVTKNLIVKLMTSSKFHS